MNAIDSTTQPLDIAKTVVACRLVDGVQWIYDVNAMCVGGWIVENVWESEVALWLMRETEPKADGTWSRTHCIEIFK